MTSSKKYINERSGSWFVRIRTGDRRINKSFAFGIWGGKCAAFIHALEWRNQMLSKYDLWGRLDFERSPNFFANTPKVQPIIGIYQTKSGEFYNWCAHYQIDYFESKTHFSVNKYGDKSAFLKACKIRYEKSGKLIVINRDALPCRPNVPYKYQKMIEV